MISIHSLQLSPGHNYIGHHGRPADKHPMLIVDAAECVAGRGLRGDRFFDHQPDFKGQVTLFADEVLAALREAFGQPCLPASALRRNVLVAGIDLNALIGRHFTLQGIAFEGVEECRPCYWMDQAVAPGAEAWLRGRGGLRCRILSDGWLRCG
jgi:MOSC domain-containing protein YiiM